MEANQSLDFDFFDTPRKPQEAEINDSNRILQSNTKTKSEVVDVPETNKSLKNSNSAAKDKDNSSLSESSDRDDDYSSDSVSSLTDSDRSTKIKNRKNSQSSGSSAKSNSSLGKGNNKHKKSPSARDVKKETRNEDLSGSEVTLSDSSDSSQSQRSYSSSNSRRRSKSKTKKTGNKESQRSNSRKSQSKSRNNRRNQESEEEEESYTSSSAYSDSAGNSSKSSSSLSVNRSGIHKNTKSASRHNDHKKIQKDQQGKQAWGEQKIHDTVSHTRTHSRNGSNNRERGGKSGLQLQERPKTAKHGRQAGSSSRSRAPPAGGSGHYESDSDITDVSPMDSPRVGVGASGDGSHVNSRAHQFKALPVHHHKEDEDEQSHNDPTSMESGIDLEILMKAVGELEKQKRVEANSRRVMFAPMNLKRSSNEKSNYTFDQARSTDIDRENDRLLKEIVRQVNADRRKQYHQKSTLTPKTKLTASAINRERDMKRIESENLNFLKRLQKVKATSTISRQNQLREYDNTKLHGVAIATLHPVGGSRPTSRFGPNITDSLSSIGSRTRSMTSLHSVASTVRSTTSTKRSSRPASATKRIDLRPQWDDRW